MVKVIITDFSRVLLFPVDKNYEGSLNALNRKLFTKDPSYVFSDYFRMNDELLECYAQLNKVMPVYVFTSDTIQEHPAIKAVITNAFSGVVSAASMGVHKSDPRAYGAVAELVSAQPDQVLYIDDNQSNLDAAAQVGFETMLYVDNKAVLARLSSLI